MKIGDLVTLSARGRKTRHCATANGRMGVIVGLHSKDTHMYPFVVSWFGSNTRAHLREHLSLIHI